MIVPDAAEAETVPFCARRADGQTGNLVHAILPGNHGRTDGAGEAAVVREREDGDDVNSTLKNDYRRPH